jgi:hypothetical protein
MIGFGAATGAAPRWDAVLWPATVAPGIACAPGFLAVAFGLAFVVADDDATDGVTNGPVNSEQPFALQPVAAGPTNVGFSGPYVIVGFALTRGFFAFPVATEAPPRTPMSSTDRDNSSNRLRKTLVRIRVLPMCQARAPDSGRV